MDAHCTLQGAGGRVWGVAIVPWNPLSSTKGVWNHRDLKPSLEPSELHKGVSEPSGLETLSGTLWDPGKKETYLNKKYYYLFRIKDTPFYTFIIYICFWTRKGVYPPFPTLTDADYASIFYVLPVVCIHIWSKAGPKKNNFFLCGKKKGPESPPLPYGQIQTKIVLSTIQNY